jgi:hypothetical protein
MTIRYEGAMYDVFLVDDGTLDTVIEVTRRRDQTSHVERFDQEYASGFRKRSGEMTREGLRVLGREVIDAWLEQAAICEHDYIDDDNSSPYGEEVCRFCGDRRSK